MKVLLTGINGFIGRNIASAIAKEHYVIGTDIGDKSCVDANEYFSWNIGNENIPNDKIPNDLDAIIHVAACLDMNGTNEQLITSNCMGTHRIYQAAKQINVKKVIYLSSLPIIGEPQIVPITETHPIEPRTIYHVTKYAGELILNQLENEQIEVVNLRLPSPIGVGMNMKTILGVFIKKALDNENLQIVGKGSRRQNYIDVRDIANIVKCFLEKENTKGTYNCGSDDTISNLELAKMCISVVNSESQIVFIDKNDSADDQNWKIDTTKLKSAIGYSNEYSIDQTIKDIVSDINKKI